MSWHASDFHSYLTGFDPRTLLSEYQTGRWNLAESPVQLQSATVLYSEDFNRWQNFVPNNFKVSSVLERAATSKHVKTLPIVDACSSHAFTSTRLLTFDQFVR